MIEVKLPRIPDTGPEPSFGPETDFDGVERFIDGDIVRSVISSISKDKSAVDYLSNEIAEHIKAAAGLRPRPDIDPNVHVTIMSHVPDDSKNDFAYFSSDLFELVQYYIALKSPQIRELKEKGILKLEIE